MRFSATALRNWLALLVLAGAVTLSATRRDGSGVNAPERRRASAPERIIPGSAAAADWLADLVEPARIAALPIQIEDFSSLALDPGRWADRPRFETFDSELVLAFQPDLVLVSPFTEPAMVARVREAGPDVVTVPEATTWNELIAAGEQLGALVEEPQRTAALLDGLRARRAALRTREGHARLRILPYGNYGTGGTSAGRGTTLDLAIELAGYQNAAKEAGIVGVDDVSIEVLLALEFDAVLMSGSPDRSPSATALRSEPALQSIPAIQGERFLFLPTPLYVAGSQWIMNAAESIAIQGDQLGG